MRQELKDIPSMRATFEGREIVERLELREQFRSQVSRVFARKAVARRAGVAPGTLERIAGGRCKSIAVAVADKLMALLVRELEAEIAQNEHEIETLRRIGARLDSDEIREVETALAKARSILNRGSAVK